MGNLNETEFKAWRGFLDTHAVLWKSLEADLLSESGLNLTDYEVLLFLEEAPDNQLRMTELARRVRMSGSGLTRVVDRLQGNGLVERRRCQEDGRGFEAVLTRRGRSQLKRLHVTHLRSVRELFINQLNETELASLAAIWHRLLGDADTHKGA